MRLILCPLKLEWTFLAESLEKQGLILTKKQNQGKWYFEVADLNSVLCIGGHGKVNFALMTQFWSRHFKNIDHIIAVGAAGALSSDINPRDVFLVNQIIEHDYKEEFTPTTPLPSFETHALSLNRNFEAFNIHQGTLASGDEDIVDESRALELREKTGAHAVAWESAGGIRAARLMNIPYSEIRGLTDQAHGSVKEDFMKNLGPAMDNCCQVLVRCLK